MVCNDFQSFESYKEDPLEIEGAGGITTSPGIGVVNLEVVLINGSTRKVQFTNVRYMPQCPVNLFSLEKIMKNGGSLYSDKIMFMENGKLIEFYGVDEHGFLLESKYQNTQAYFLFHILTF